MFKKILFILAFLLFPSLVLAVPAEYTIDVMIAKNRSAWREWQFQSEGADSAFIYLWDFGDKKVSQEVNPTHTFPGWGTYKVTLSVSDSQGGLGTAETIILVGFWNLANPWLQAILGVLGLLLIGLTVVAIGNFLPQFKRD